MRKSQESVRLELLECVGKLDSLGSTVDLLIQDKYFPEIAAVALESKKKEALSLKGNYTLSEADQQLIELLQSDSANRVFGKYLLPEKQLASTAGSQLFSAKPPKAFSSQKELRQEPRRHAVDVLAGHYYLRECSCLLKLTVELQMLRNYVVKGMHEKRSDERITCSFNDVIKNIHQLTQQRTLSEFSKELGLTAELPAILASAITSFSQVPVSSFMKELMTVLQECRRQVKELLSNALQFNDFMAIYASMVLVQKDLMYTLIDMDVFLKQFADQAVRLIQEQEALAEQAKICHEGLGALLHAYALDNRYYFQKLFHCETKDLRTLPANMAEIIKLQRPNAQLIEMIHGYLEQAQHDDFRNFSNLALYRNTYSGIALFHEGGAIFSDKGFQAFHDNWYSDAMLGQMGKKPTVAAYAV